MTKTKKKGFPLFWVFYFLFILCMILFWVLVVKKVKECLVIYENSQPERKVEMIIQAVQNGYLDEYFSVEGQNSPYEAADVYKKAYKARIEGKEITYQKDTTTLAEKPLYRMYADQDLFGTVELRETSKEPLMLILSLSTWEVADTKAIYETGEKSVTVKVPNAYKVYVNGVELNDSSRIGDAEEMEQFRYVKDYVECPTLVSYQVKGLLNDPEVKICNQKGETVDYAEVKTEGLVTSASVEEFPVSQMDASLEKMVMDNAIRYSNFFSKDLEGCRNSVAPIADMFPKDSYYLELADKYRREDMWMYSAHNTPEFLDKEVSNYIEYSDNLFSCEVFFNKQMYLSRNKQYRTDVTHTRYYYGKIDGAWKILDMVALSQN